MRFLSFRESIFASLIVHLLLVGFILFFDDKFPYEKPQAVTIELLSNNEQKSEDFKPDESIKNQVVEQNKSINDEKPVKTDLVSEQNQAVKKQTVAKNKGEFQNIREKQMLAKKETPATKSKPSLKDLTPQFDALAVKEKQQREEQQKEQEQAQHAQAASDGSRTNDYLKDVDEGLETMLNTREFKYYTYYARIRRQLSQYWEPKVKEKIANLFHKGRHIASDRDHITKLLIVLNDQGNLVRVQVLSESGVLDLDDAATEAFKAAAPFPNPPKGIIESDGTVKIRWDFVLES